MVILPGGGLVVLRFRRFGQEHWLRVGLGTGPAAARLVTT